MIFGKPLKEFDKGERPYWFYHNRRQRYNERVKQDEVRRKG
jgi:hypothetical protein